MILLAQDNPLIKSDTITAGILMVLLALVFWLSNHPSKYAKRFFTVVPALLLCYLLPAILSSANIISPKVSNTYDFAKNYLLPAALILMTLSIDLKGVAKLGWRAVVMFFTGTFGIIIGGPLAILIVQLFNPDVVGGEGFDAAWRGMSTIAGSWIGGGANQTAMLEVFQYNQDKYGAMVVVDIVVANIWMAILLYAASKKNAIDNRIGADTRSIDELQFKLEEYQKKTAQIPHLKDLMILFGIVFGFVGLSHFIGNPLASFFEELNIERMNEVAKMGRDKTPSDFIYSTFSSNFFWLIVFATSIGLVLSFTKAKKLEAYGASKFGSLFIYFLVATIGMKMDLSQMKENWEIIYVGLIWMAIHALILIVVGRLIKAPLFYLAVGSKANVGGAASAPVVAAAFHPSLAPVGALLAVLGYAVGTYGAVLCAMLMESVAP